MAQENNKDYKKGYSSRKLCFLLLILCAGIAYYLWIRSGGFSVPCLFHEVTGLYCPISVLYIPVSAVSAVIQRFQMGQEREDRRKV